MNKNRKPSLKSKLFLNKKIRSVGVLLAAAAVMAVSGAPMALAASGMADAGHYSGLPVSSVKSYPVSSSQGTVILLPQYHRDPSSTSINDPVNDSGVRNQQQTEEVLKRLVTDDHISLIMEEGGLQGEVPQSKIDHLKNEIAARDQYVKSMDNLKQAVSESGIGQAEAQKLYSQLDGGLEYANRDIYLQGAPNILKAQGYNVDLIGAEKQETLDAAAAVVRDYVYLNDRLAQVSKTQPAGQAKALAGSGQGLQQILRQLTGGKTAQSGNNLQQMLKRLQGQMPASLFNRQRTAPGVARLPQGANLQQMLQQLLKGKSQPGNGMPQAQTMQQLPGNKKTAAKSMVGGSNAMQQMLQQMMGKKNTQPQSLDTSAMKNIAQSKGDARLSAALTAVEESYQNLQASSQTFTAVSVTAGPSRADNPYANINDAKTLQDMLAKNRQQVDTVVIGRRNQEAAGGLAQAMKDKGQSVSILRFGACHEQGLVSELNKQNLDVIVITTNEVAARAGQQ